ncbi:MAG: hypothetical protein NT000_03995 [Proteobacteria bacterium]|nr:hypothetical protein [Pseudomonadota bacterium]
MSGIFAVSVWFISSYLGIISNSAFIANFVLVVMGILIQAYLFDYRCYPIPAEKRIYEERRHAIVLGMLIPENIKLPNLIQRLGDRFWLRLVVVALILFFWLLFENRGLSHITTEASATGFLCAIVFAVAIRPEILWAAVLFAGMSLLYSAPSAATGVFRFFIFLYLGIFLLVFSWFQNFLREHFLIMEETNVVPNAIAAKNFIQPLLYFSLVFLLSYVVLPDFKKKNKTRVKINTPQLHRMANRWSGENHNGGSRNLSSDTGGRGTPSEQSSSQANTNNNFQLPSTGGAIPRVEPDRDRASPKNDSPEKMMDLKSAEQKEHEKNEFTLRDKGENYSGGDRNLSSNTGGRGTPSEQSSTQANTNDNFQLPSTGGAIPRVEPDRDRSFSKNDSPEKMMDLKSAEQKEHQAKNEFALRDKGGPSEGLLDGKLAKEGDSPDGGLKETTDGKETADGKKPSRHALPKIPKLTLPKKIPMVKAPLLFAILGLACFFLFFRKKKEPVKNSPPKLPTKIDVALLKAFENSIQTLVHQKEAPSREMVIKLYNQFLRYAANYDFSKAVFETPDEYVLKTESRLQDCKEQLGRVTTVFCDAFYGHEQPTSQNFNQYLSDLSDLTKTLSSPEAA